MALLLSRKREFKLTEGSKTTILPDPNPNMTPDEVIEFYIPQYPKLINSTLSEQLNGEVMTYTILGRYDDKG